MAQLIENVWQFNKAGVSEKTKEIDSAVQTIFMQIRELSNQLDLKKNCLKQQHIDRIIENSIKNVNIETNPIPVSTGELKDPLASCFEFL